MPASRKAMPLARADPKKNAPVSSRACRFRPERLRATAFALNARSAFLLAGFLLTMFSSFGQTFFIGLSGNELRAAFSLSDGEFGTIYMLATLGSALTLPWLGKFLDVLPGRKMALFVMPALAAACLLMAYAPHVGVLALAIYLLRLLGQGMMTHIALTDVSRWFVANRGRAISLIGPGQQAEKRSSRSRSCLSPLHSDGKSPGRRRRGLRCWLRSL
jgi:hypothetical protein